MTEETPSAYLVWWNQNHASDFTREGVYEKHSKKCFSAGYAIAATETDELRAEVARLREALGWYGEQVHTFSTEQAGKRWGVALDLDGGSRARAALAHKEDDQ
tara:strand:+ start:873 stop:1181 length:309 start_codon:yes stop_codon:yes gene_type:complete